MLPNKVLQLDYQDISYIISKHIDSIIKYETQQDSKFDLILAKLRNGTVGGSMIANHFQIPMGVIEMPRKAKPQNFKVFFSLEIDKKLKKGELVNILFVDGICGTGQTLEELEIFINQHKYHKQINLVTYCTLVDANAKKKPDIMGLEVQDRFFQPPWEWRSFTPQAHLDRLELGNIKASEEIEFCIGFVSKKVVKMFEAYFSQNVDFDWTMIFEEADINTNDKDITLESIKNTYNKILEDKVNFIEQNGLTHFIEEDIRQALLLSQSCPVCHIIYIEKNNLFRVFAKEIDKVTF